VCCQIYGTSSAPDTLNTSEVPNNDTRKNTNNTVLKTQNSAKRCVCLRLCLLALKSYGRYEFLVNIRTTRLEDRRTEGQNYGQRPRTREHNASGADLNITNGQSNMLKAASNPLRKSGLPSNTMFFVSSCVPKSFRSKQDIDPLSGCCRAQARYRETTFYRKTHRATGTLVVTVRISCI